MSNLHESLDGVETSLITENEFAAMQGWEPQVLSLLGHWCAGIEKRIAQHEKMSNQSSVLEVIRVPFLVFALIMAAMTHGMSAETRAGAFFLLAIGQTVVLFMDPSGWRERHRSFADRYTDLFQEIAEALSKSKSSRERRGGPPISTLVTRRQSYFRQGLAGEEYVKDPHEGESFEDSAPWGEGSQQSQLALVVACRLNKLEGSRPRGLIDWTYYSVPPGC